MENKDETKKADNWAEMSDQEEEQEQPAEEKNHVIKPAKKKIPPAQKGTKNSHGDYVVTSIDIPDMRTGVKKDDEGKVIDEDTDSDTEYDDEDDQNDAAAKEEVKEGKYFKN